MRTISTQFFKVLHENPSFASIATKKKNTWEWYTRHDIYQKIISCSLQLQHHHIERGDRIVYKGNNTLEWFCWNIAANNHGAIWVPIYNAQPHSYYQHILHDCDPKLIIHDQNMLNIETKIPSISHKIDTVNDRNMGLKIHDKNDISTLIYTSGTTGSPKGVILTNENILSNIDSIRTMYHDISNMKSLSVLPWAHIYGQTCELYYNILNDNQLAICSDKNLFLSECRQVQPSVLFLVPKILEIIEQKLEILNKPGLQIIIPFILKKLLGSNVQFVFCGGAALQKSTLNFFEKNGLIICQGYGCSETSPMISLNHPSSPRNMDSIGQILNNVHIEIINDEICIHGPNVMSGYWKQPIATQKAFISHYDKNFYRTGDSGYIKDNFLFYTGRLGENYKLTNGKFVNVVQIENQIQKCLPKNSNFIIFGDSQNHLICDKPISLEQKRSINKNLEKPFHIQKTYHVPTNIFNSFQTPKMSIKRRDLIQHVKSLNI